MNTRLRWILLAPCVLAVWLVVFAVMGSWYARVTDRCYSAPAIPECSGPLFLALKNGLPSLGAALAATLVLLVAFVVAPGAKGMVTRICFAVGAALACIGSALFAIEGSWHLFFAACSALVAGTIARHALLSRLAVKELAHDA
jgi:hypothetical protein